MHLAPEKQRNELRALPNCCNSARMRSLDMGRCGMKAGECVHREIYKLFEIEVVRTGLERAYGLIRPEFVDVPSERLRHLHALVGGFWQRKLVEQGASPMSNYGGIATFGSVDSAVRSAKKSIDAEICYRFQLGKSDPYRLDRWDNTQISWYDMELTILREEIELARRFLNFDICDLSKRAEERKISWLETAIANYERHRANRLRFNAHRPRLTTPPAEQA